MEYGTLRSLRAFAALLHLRSLYSSTSPVDEQVRLARLPRSLASDLDRLAQVEAHSTEIQVAKDLLSAADLTVDRQSSPEVK